MKIRTAIAAGLLALSLGGPVITAATPAAADGFSVNVNVPKNSKAGKKLAKANAAIGLLSGLTSSTTITQRGKLNNAGVVQRGGNSSAHVGQFGSNHEANVDQSGGNNSAGVLQFGKGSKCKVKQTGDQASLCIGAGG